MRELTLDELNLVAGGLQQSTSDGGGGSGDPGDPPPSDPPPSSEPALPSLISMVAPTQEVLQRFFDDLSDAAITHNEYSGSDYDHDMGGDYAYYDLQFAELTHDPSAGVPYWDPDYGVDSGFLEAVIEGMQGLIVDGVVSLPGTGLDNAVALETMGQNHVGAFVNGLYYTGIYHPGDAPPPDWSGSLPSDIIINGGQGGYWTFSVDTIGDVQTGFDNSNVPSVAINYRSDSGLNGTSGYPPGWDTARDHDVDQLAQDLAAQIENKSDSTYREYSAYIWMDSNGVLHQSLILQGNYNNAGAQDGSGLMNPMSAYGIPPNAILVAGIHNHPEYYTFTDSSGAITSRKLNPMYSYTDTGDMNSMTSVVQNYATESAGNINYYRNYVVWSELEGSRAMHVDEYDYVQHQTGPIPGDNRALPGAVKGDYNP